MFENGVIPYDDLLFIHNRLEALDLGMSCNIKLVERIILDLPSCSPFSLKECLSNNTGYREWCALRDATVSQAKEVLNERSTM